MRRVHSHLSPVLSENHLEDLPRGPKSLVLFYFFPPPILILSTGARNQANSASEVSCCPKTIFGLEIVPANSTGPWSRNWLRCSPEQARQHGGKNSGLVLSDDQPRKTSIFELFRKVSCCSARRPNQTRISFSPCCRSRTRVLLYCLVSFREVVCPAA